MYLVRAVDEFHRSANAPDLWIPADAWHRESLLQGPQEVLNALNRRLHFLRGAVLFAAIASEAFANELLDEILAPSDVKALDALPAAEKLRMATRLVGQPELLARNRDPLQGLLVLGRTRNRLVHPRPQGGIAAWSRDVLDEDEIAVGPRAARRAILNVADAVVLCTELRKHPGIHGGSSKTIARNRHLLDAHQAAAGPKINDLPDRDAEGTPGFFDQIAEAAATKWRASSAESRAQPD